MAVAATLEFGNNERLGRLPRAISSSNSRRKRKAKAESKSNTEYEAIRNILIRLRRAVIFTKPTAAAIDNGDHTRQDCHEPGSMLHGRVGQDEVFGVGQGRELAGYGSKN